MKTVVQELVRALDLERIEENIFRGIVPPAAGGSRVFGGLVVAQALAAAARTVDGRVPHSLHAYFILPGDAAAPIVYEVERVRDGRSFTTRRCAAIQNGRHIFDLFASFQLPQTGLDFTVAMPNVPSPAALPNVTELIAQVGDRLPAAFRTWFARERAVEVKPCDLSRYDPRQPPRPFQNVWIRIGDRLPDDPALHRAMLAYFSDLTLIDVTLAAHGRSLFEPDIAVASLDHALWFHRPFRADEWLLYAQDCVTTGGGRGLARGLLFSEHGELVASVMQEGLIRQSQGASQP